MVLNPTHYAACLAQPIIPTVVDQYYRCAQYISISYCIHISCTVKPPLSGPPIYGHLPLPGRLYVRACASYNLARFASGPAMASKRKRSVMSLEKKLDIITQIRQGRSQRAVADGFGVAKSTVGDIWKNREKIEIHVSASTNPAFAKKRCIVRDAHFHKLDEACYIWFQQQRAKGAPVSGPLLQEKAKSK